MSISIKCKKEICDENLKLNKTKDGKQVILCENCPYIDSNDEECSSCYGQVAIIIDKPNKIYRNHFILKKENIIEKLNYDKFVDKRGIHVHYNVKQNDMWSYGDRPINYKTACLICKQKCAKKNRIPDCEMNDHLCKQQKSRILYFK